MLMRLMPSLTTALILAAVLAAAPARTQAQSQAEIGSLKIAIDLVERGKGVEALATAAEFKDTAARDLVTWLALRTDWRAVGFDKASAFLRDNADWPSATTLLRRRTETLLYEEKRDARIVRAFFSKDRPIAGEGKLALARALLASGDSIGALPLVKSAWRSDDLSPSVENEALATFPNMIGRDDHKARADMYFFAENRAGAMRSAERAGPDVVALEKARVATDQRAKNANALISAVPASLRDDTGLAYARMQYRWRADDAKGAAEIMLATPRDPKLLGDTTKWWREVRVVVRGLLDRGDPRLAYRMAAHLGRPESENYRADQQFTAGWIALRYLKEPATAAKHFAQLEKESDHPITLGRAFYWQGRTAEAANQDAAARAAYEKAARFTTTYYGQIARARLGLKDLPLARPLEPTAAERTAFNKRDYVRALRLLYATDNRQHSIAFYNDITDRAVEQSTILLLAAVAYEQRDPRGMVLIGKAAYDRGILIDTIAFPVFGIPDIPKDEPQADRALIYAIARQESQFQQSAASHASAYGLMQVIPPTARAISRRLGIQYDLGKLRGDPVYNARLGANELGHLLQQFNGSYILSFVGYNAGPGRAREWIAKYGDPRDPKVDAIDWVERVPFSETRFYIQRVMENMQVYRVLFGDKPGFRIEADLSTGRG
jgi:soluble lytic murein transglycosylase